MRAPRRLVTRELSDEQIREQAARLADFVCRGGSASRWLDSKGFLPGDRAAILVAWADIEDGDAA